MVAALGSDRANALSAFSVLSRLLSRHELPSEQVKSAQAMMVSMQAVPRLCNLLTPDIPGWTGDEKKESKG